MLKGKMKGIIAATGLMAITPFANAETFYYDNYHPKYESDLTIEMAENLEVQVFPSMLDSEKLGDFYNYNKKFQNSVKAYEHYRVAAREGSNYGQYMIGKMKLTGLGVDKNIFEARNILEKVKSPYDTFANRLLAESYFNTGEIKKAKMAISKVKTPEALHAFAISIMEDDSMYATALLQQAAEMGHMRSNLSLGKHYLKKNSLNTQEAIEHLKTAAKNGMEEAQFLLGELYFKGNSQMYAHHEEGLRWYIIAGQNGNEDAIRKAYWVLEDQSKTGKYMVEENNPLKEKLLKILNEMDGK